MHRAWKPVLVAIAMVGAATAAAPAEPKAVANLETTAGRLTWQPAAVVNGARLALTVAGPGGFALEKTFEPGEEPALSLFERAGLRLAEGVYTYELRVERGAEAPALSPQLAGKAARAAQVQSGSFAVRSGRFQLPASPLRARDVVQSDNLIVSSRACIGPSCAAGDATQTLVLKDSALRVWFHDPAGDASPHHDWTLEINDLTGAGERFSIFDNDAGTTPFTILANAPSHSLYVSASGNLGLGTSAPQQDVHMVSGDSPTVRLDQDTTGGHAAQVWEVGGNEVSFFVRDVTSAGKLPLRIRPGAPASSLDIAANGNVGMGTASPSRSLDISRAGVVDIGLQNTAGTSVRWFLQTDNDLYHTFKISREGGGGPVLTLDSRQDLHGVTLKLDGSIQATNVIYSSSRALKTEIAPLDGRDVLARLSTLPISQWRFKTEGEPVRHIGPMAEDFQAAFGVGSDGQHISATDANGIALAAIQGLSAEHRDRERKLAELKARIESLTRRLEAQSPSTSTDGQ